MKLVAIMPVRNEAWVLGASLRVALSWCDEVVILNHASTDDTADIIQQVESEHRGRVHVISESGAMWPEMDHRQRLLETARHRKATHIALIDADEVICGDWINDVRATFESLRPGEHLHVGMPCPWRGLYQYRVDRGSIWANRYDLCIGFADHPALCWKAADGYDHHHREPYGSRLAGRIYAAGGVMHLQWASWRRLVAKHMAYRVNERLKFPGKPVAQIERLYSLALDEAGLMLTAVPANWWAPHQDLLGYIDLNAVPWQEQYVREMIQRHGAQHFEGLSVFEEVAA